MQICTDNLFQAPPYEKGFYILEKFFNHIHDSETANFVYVIPWEQGFLFTLKRDPATAGCVGCLVRRLISTTYHKHSKIERIDSVYYPQRLHDSEHLNHIYKKILQMEISSTKCIYIQNNRSEEIHILPTPGCQCAAKPYPKINTAIANSCLKKWPHIEESNLNTNMKTFHIRSSRLPNTAPLFLRYPGTHIIAGSPPTAADFRDSNHLDIRLHGESIERYASTYAPSSYYEINHSSGTYEINKNQLIQVENLFGESKWISVKHIYSLFHRLSPNNFPPISSSGVSAHQSLEAAKLSAALELVERDSLINAWRLSECVNFSSFFALPISHLDKIRELSWAQHLANQQSHELYIVGVKNQLQLPMVLTFTIPSNNVLSSPNFGVGIGMNWPTAIHKSLCELLQGLAVPDFETLEGFPKNFVERPRFWKQQDRKKILKTRLSPKSDPLQLDDYLKEYSLKDLNSDVLREIYFANLTPPDVLISGWHVIRAINEAYEPFPGSYMFEKPSIQRVNQFLCSQKMQPVAELNIDPFPFP